MFSRSAIFPSYTRGLLIFHLKSASLPKKQNLCHLLVLPRVVPNPIWLSFLMFCRVSLCLFHTTKAYYDQGLSSLISVPDDTSLLKSCGCLCTEQFEITQIKSPPLWCIYKYAVDLLGGASSFMFHVIMSEGFESTWGWGNNNNLLVLIIPSIFLKVYIYIWLDSMCHVLVVGIFCSSCDVSLLLKQLWTSFYRIIIDFLLERNSASIESQRGGMEHSRFGFVCCSPSPCAWLRRGTIWKRWGSPPTLFPGVSVQIFFPHHFSLSAHLFLCCVLGF